MKLIIGLQNPGNEYERTRHNTGGAFVGEFVKRVLDVPWKEEPKLFARVARSRAVICAQPTTFMNESGKAVAALVRFYKIKPADLLLVHDDADLPLSEVRLHFDRSSAGHKGVESVIRALRTQKFDRLRLGIGPKRGHKEAGGMVLRKLSTSEYTELNRLFKKLIPGIETWLKEGRPIAQNVVNSL